MTNFVTCCHSCDETIVIGDSDSESPLPEFSVEISPPDSDQIPIYTPTESSGSQTSAANSSRFGNRDNNDTVTSLASTLHAHSGRIINGVPLAIASITRPSHRSRGKESEGLDGCYTKSGSP